MTNDQFDRLVARLELQANKHPGLYKLRVLLLSMLGYGYIAVMLAALLLAAVVAVVLLKGFGVKLAIGLLILIWMVLAALWVRLEPPQGRRVTRQEAPELFAMIKDLRKRLKAPRFHRVLITDEFNAAVSQTPRLGVLGWHRNYLIIGLPLMKSLSVEQFRAVLAHEFGHLAGGHGRLSNWIYRSRLGWHRLVESLTSEGRFGSFLFRRFFNWYVPYFTAFSFPLARANEYEADAAAARLTSPRAMAQALTAVNVVGEYLNQNYWSGIHRSADELPRPAFGPYAGMAERVDTELEEGASRMWLDNAMAQRTTSADTHPSLADRLQAIGEQPSLELPKAVERADRLLGPSLETITSEFDSSWEESILPAWQQRYETASQGRARLQELDARVEQGEALEPADAFERARLTEEFGAGSEAALVLYRAVHEQTPNDPVINFVLGTRLLNQDDGAGVALVERAIALDEEAALAGYEILRDYCWRRGQEAAADAWHDRLVERQTLLANARRERDFINLRDKFDRHGLSAEQIRTLRAQLRAIGVRRAYLVRKRVKYLPEHPLFVLGYYSTPWWKLFSAKRAAQISQRIADHIEVPGELFVLHVDGDNARFGRKFRWRRGTRV